MASESDGKEEWCGWREEACKTKSQGTWRERGGEDLEGGRRARSEGRREDALTCEGQKK